jgi:D-alanyl-D-alanine carboxypeptidase
MPPSSSPSLLLTRRGLSRRNFLTSSALATLAAGGNSLLGATAQHAVLPMPAADGPVDTRLDGYIAAYMQAMNAPGLTLGLTNASETLRTAGYGFADVDRKIAVNGDHLFQIGSITKSFVALVILQLREEGKVDLHKPVLDYLPGLPIACSFGTITIHHLLTHTSGLPDSLNVFSTNPEERLVQGYKPGEHFHYCNAGFDILGLLAVKLDGRSWKRCVEARILMPLKMTATAGVITTSLRSRAAIGYEPYWDDEEYPRQGRLAPAPNLVMDDTAGCIASTPGDMAIYLRMLLNQGKGPHGRIVNEESFGLFSTPYIKADEFSPTASYGYGVAVDTLDGHKILRHTGGMVAFASSMHVDLDGGVAAFASINAMQGYRPTAVTEYAVRLLRARHEDKPLPDAPEIADPLHVENANEYVGTFTSADGTKLEFQSRGTRLTLIDGRDSVPLQHAGGDNFISTVAGRFAAHALSFGRRLSDTPAKSEGSKERSDQGSQDEAVAPQPPVVEVSYGAAWFVNDDYAGPRTFPARPEYDAFIGRYRSDSPWGADLEVYMLKGELTLGGETVTPLGGNLFRSGDDAWTPETAEFFHIFEGKARLLKIAGMDCRRVEVA